MILAEKNKEAVITIINIAVLQKPNVKVALVLLLLKRSEMMIKLNKKESLATAIYFIYTY